MTRKQRRLALIASALAVLGVAAGLVLFAFQIPSCSSTDRRNSPRRAWRRARGCASAGWCRRAACSAARTRRVVFQVTDTNKVVQVSYRGLLPDLFREGQGVVAEGVLAVADRLQGRQRAGQA